MTRKQKLLLYKAGVCPRMNWELVTRDFPISWVSSTLEATVTRFLKRWSGLARPADTARLYLPIQEGGLGLPSIKLLYKRLRVSQSALLLTSRDHVTRQVASRLVKREEKLVRPVFKPSLLCREVMKDDPGASGRSLAK